MIQPNSDGSYFPDKNQRPVEYENSIARAVVLLSLGAFAVEKKYWPLLVGGGFLGYRLMTLKERYNMPPQQKAAESPTVAAKGCPRMAFKGSAPTSQQIGEEPQTMPRFAPEPITNFQDALSARTVDLGYSLQSTGGEIDLIFPKPNKRQQRMESGWGNYGWERNPLNAIDWQQNHSRAPEDQREIQATAYKEF